MKKSKLELLIKDGKNKICPACAAPITCSSFCKRGKIFFGREFWCTQCKSKYVYRKYGRTFSLISADYNLPNCLVKAKYKDYLTGKDLQKFEILPCDRTFPYTSWYYGQEVKLNKPLEFPISREDLEDKVSLYITFL